LAFLYHSSAGTKVVLPRDVPDASHPVFGVCLLLSSISGTFTGSAHDSALVWQHGK
jgi:hypothetical protein